LKLKCVKEQEFVIGGYTEPRGSRIGFGALLLGYYRGGRLVYAGKVGTGFDRATLRRLRQKLSERHRSARSRAIACREVAFIG
jgi:bifunctional non-homologous end joining protein LigD